MKDYDLEDRTYRFAQRVRAFTKSIPRTVENIEDIRQLTRASGSTGANYIEANESFSAKDFVFRIKLCRKEAKESGYFLRLLDPGGAKASQLEREDLAKEAQELTRIFAAILRKCGS